MHTSRLRQVSDQMPGIRRVRSRAGFRYRSVSGKAVGRKELQRIRSLAIPPAWEEVWICPFENGHLQATGVDSRGRKQYRYHPGWRAWKDEQKYRRLLGFGKALPTIRRKVAADLRRKGLPRRKVLAAMVRLLESTLIRVGNEQYARDNSSFGLSTFRDRHAHINGGELRFQFVGKGGKRHSITLNDPRLARVVKNCRDLPGELLFQYIAEDGEQSGVTSNDVNAYLKECTGEEYTAKDFRTWAGTVLAAMALREFRDFDSKAEAKRNINRAIESVAKRLGNTPTICRKCYVHPEVFEGYLDGTLRKGLEARTRRQLLRLHELTPEEAAVLAFLHQRLKRGRIRRSRTAPRQAARTRMLQ